MKKKKPEDWRFDMSVCPDCHTVQSKSKHAGDDCDNPNCESSIMVYRRKNSKNDGRLMWSNDNWC